MPDQGKLDLYAQLVRSYSSKLDLVSPGDLERFEERHIADSLRALPLIEASPPGPCADVGSGAGLPGIPLAIASDRPWRLFEPRHRRAAFLEEVVRELDLDCEVHRMTAQEAATRSELRHGFATARALAPPDQAFAWLLPLLVEGGRAVVFHGAAQTVPSGAEAWSDGISFMTLTSQGAKG